MDEAAERTGRRNARHRHNEEFVANLRARRPDVAAAAIERAERAVAADEGVAGAGRPFEDLGGVATVAPAEVQVFETIVREERPVLFVQDDWVNKTEVTLRGEEARELVDALEQHRARLTPLLPLIGRIDVAKFPGLEYVGTAWLVAPDVAVTNRHVASLIAHQEAGRFVFSRGVGGDRIEASLCTAHEFDDLTPDTARIFAIEEVLYIESDGRPNDVAFLKVKRSTDGTRPTFIPVAAENIQPDTPVLVVGYPARASKRVIPDQELMRDLYRDRYDVKRAAPGLTMRSADGTMRHDCTTLGGNSGSVVLNPASGQAAGLHFAGLYQEANFAVNAVTLGDYIKRKVWNTPPVIESRPSTVARPHDTAPPAASATSTVHSVPATSNSAATATNGHSTSILIPLTITVTVGAPVASSGATSTGSDGAGAPGGGATLTAAEAAAKAFWTERPEGVIAVRVGFSDDDGVIGDVPFIAASVPPRSLASVEAAGPASFQGFDVRYFPADAAEQVAAMPAVESVDSISYDDDARKGDAFSFDLVEKEMDVRAHVGPEFSWDVLKKFLDDEPKSKLVSAIYEFHATHIADALEARLVKGGSLRLVMDNASFSKVKDGDFDRVKRFADWEQRFGSKFQRIVAPEGTAGLISDAYHIKVTVRDDDTFWLSSGNWKAESSQPIVSQDERDNAENTDLPGNREWHVVIRNKELASRFRNHIRQDFTRSEELGASTLPPRLAALEEFVDVPLEEALEFERRPPERVLGPRDFSGSRRVRPLLTPDREGAVYSEAVLELIRSAKKSLFFQIPYIGMPSNPREDRGYIDALIKALTLKLKTLDDARLLLRSGSSKLSAPTHAAWYFKSKGVDIASRVRQMEDHHTKGMIVDGKRVLLGSHNWSKPGVTLNRDASLLFDDSDIAGYFTEAFEIDWERANPVRPRRFVKPEGVLEAVGSTPPPGYERVRVRELLEQDD